MTRPDLEAIRARLEAACAVYGESSGNHPVGLPWMADLAALLEYVERQRAALDKLQRKYNTLKGTLLKERKDRENAQP